MYIFAIVLKQNTNAYTTEMSENTTETMSGHVQVELKHRMPSSLKRYINLHTLIYTCIHMFNIDLIIRVHI